MVGVAQAVQGAVPEPGAGRQAAPRAAGCPLLRAGAEAEAAAGVAGAVAEAEAVGAVSRAAAVPSAGRPAPTGAGRNSVVGRSWPSRPP